MRQKIISLTKKNFRIDTFRSGGPGGQNQNKRSTGVRIVHQASGAVGESREHRTQLENKKAAFKRLTEHPKMHVWIMKQAHIEEIEATSTRRYTYKKEASIDARKMDHD